jgi:hypothetical protein
LEDQSVDGRVMLKWIIEVVWYGALIQVTQTDWQTSVDTETIV